MEVETSPERAYNVECHEIVIDLEFLEGAQQDPTRGSVAREYISSVVSLILNWATVFVKW